MSLRVRLLLLIVGVLAALLLLLGVLSFRITLQEVDELSDGRLAQSAHTLAILTGRQNLPVGEGPAPTLPRDLRVVGEARHTYESEVGFQLFDAQGRLRLTTLSLRDMPPPTADESGFADRTLGHHRWRIFTAHDDARGLRVRVGERYDSRRDITRALWLEHGVPLVLGLPLLALLVGWAVRRGLRPLDALTAALAARAPGSHEPVALPDAPEELKPVLHALNGQLERLEDALERERRFSADVAHELRTPLASAIIHIESALGGAGDEDTRLALRDAQRNLDALARRVSQLLALARLEAGAAAGPQVALDLGDLAMAVIDELAPLIAAGGAELALQRPSEPLTLHGHEAALVALLRNLIENALRHVPDGGHVLVQLAREPHGVRLEVIDDGPGIPPERRAGVFRRFHREAGARDDGYGLGLSIVQRAAELHRARIALLDAPAGRGLCVRVTFPDPDAGV